ncbi:HU family DNA-binding protein [Streptosporangium sp. NPDC006007]|uniref:HU family DNA-binding protein n=1 Tax=Streptosporangium sp. NPDC006007 TaxID=3154575 RepID=UPI0033ABE9F0
MNKTQLIDAVAQAIGDRPAAVHAVNTVLESIQDAVARGEKVSITGFGAFEAVDRSARTAKNPVTGAEIHVPAKRAPKFRPGSGFKDLVHQGGRAAVSA